MVINMQNNVVGTIIRNMRKRNDFTQETLAKLLFLDKSTISAYELGKIMPPTDVFLRICEVCKFELVFKNNEKEYELKKISKEY